VAAYIHEANRTGDRDSLDVTSPCSFATTSAPLQPIVTVLALYCVFRYLALRVSLFTGRKKNYLDGCVLSSAVDLERERVTNEGCGGR
jgi:hypothetical protein